MAERSKRLVAVDAAIFSIIEGKLKVFLLEREKEPFKGCLELLGGFVLEDETCEMALQRKLSSISEGKISFTQFAVFSKPSRDPRNEVISIGYLSLASNDVQLRLGKFYDINNLPKMSFDHKEIALKAREHLRKNADSMLNKESMPGFFPLNDLQKAYEILLGKRLDNRNFRKKMILSGIAKPANITQKSVGHRPAMLYRMEK